MAECSYAYCVQERRAIKKELQRWTKNMVFVVGLERIAEELMGRRKWKQYQEDVLVSPSTLEAEAEVPSDWEPTDKCCFCDGAALPDLAVNPSLSDSESSSNSQSSFRETPPAILPESHHNHHFPTTNHSPSNTMTTLESVTSMAASLAAVAALSSNQNHSISVTSPSATTAGTMPFYPTPHHTGLFPPWYLAPSPPHPLANMVHTIPPSVTALTDGLKMETDLSIKQEVSAAPLVMPIPQTVTEQPLDLSAKATDSGTIAPCQQSLRVPNIDNKHIFK
uniref:Uncharacterized protein n=1 Tax=Timema tahoe TaxID=61484 RepID=A0A7R9III5_9NEOP|nr:unnamed protein product [Timema tahoe]